MEEIWKDIENTKGRYQVSNFGRVRSLDYTDYDCLNRKYTHKGQILKPILMTNGYYSVSLLMSNGIWQRRTVHRLVAEAFIPNPNNYPCVNHKDENKTNNSVDNLEWCTYEYNANYGTAIQRMAESMPKRPVSQFDLKGNWIKNWPSIAEVKRSFGKESTAISHVCNLNNKIYHTWMNFIWRYTLPEYGPGYKLDVSDINTTHKTTTPVTQFNLQGHFIKNWPSMIDAARELNISHTSIICSCKKKMATAGHFIWRYTVPEYKEGYILDISDIDVSWQIRIPVDQFDLEGNWMKTWDYATQAQKALNYGCVDVICNMCRGITYLAKDFYWRYHRPEFKKGYNLFNIDMNLATSVPVGQYDAKTNMLLHIHPSCVEANKQLGVGKFINGWQGIYQCCQNILPLYRGYKWQFICNTPNQEINNYAINELKQ